ncbi:hypothetical protein ACFE04_004427 [Oxalis oulophora]
MELFNCRRSSSSSSTLLLLAFFFFVLHGYYAEQAPNFTFINEAILAPRLMYFDYVIIGGGTSGCPLAATLSQNASVLLLERGGSPYGNPNITNIGNFVQSLSDSAPLSPSQIFISEDGVYNSRARVLGGGSALNAGFYTRASFDFIKEVGWSESLVNQSFEWLEKKVAFEPVVNQWQSAVRDGLLEAGVLPNNGFTYEHKYGTKIGGTIFDSEGHRHTSADLLEYADPNRTTVYLHATVTRILITRRGKRRPTAYGVIFRDSFGILHRAFINRNPLNEIILTAGALGSPQILMLSGVGPAAHLQAQGIRLVIDQPEVGQGMADNPMNALFIPSPLPVEISLVQVVGITPFDSYIESASGLSFSYPYTHRLFRDPADFSNQTYQPLALLSTSRSSFPETVSAVVNATLRGGVILEKVMGPFSSGHLLLRNRNPNDNPSVTFNYFQEPEDLRRCVQGMRTIINVINSRAFSRFRYRTMSVRSLMSLMLNLPMNLRPKHRIAAISLEQFCIDTVMTIWHYHGGCLVGRVVDYDYRVMGVDSLRVIDGSTFHRSPGTNPQATLMMLGSISAAYANNSNGLFAAGLAYIKARERKKERRKNEGQNLLLAEEESTRLSQKLNDFNISRAMKHDNPDIHRQATPYVVVTY